jgi:thiamine biosynthesis lipoprotein
LRLDPKVAAGPIFDRMLAEIDRLVAIFSVYDADSELMRWQATSGPQAVSEELARVLTFAEEMRVRTGGAFNPAVQSRLADPENAVEVPSGPTYVVDLAALTATRLSAEPLTLNGVAKGTVIGLIATCGLIWFATR